VKKWDVDERGVKVGRRADVLESVTDNSRTSEVAVGYMYVLFQCVDQDSKSVQQNRRIPRQTSHELDRFHWCKLHR
jgi:hypothetical protein